MIKVKIFSSKSTHFAENVINKFSSENQNIECVDIKCCADAHNDCITYIIIYNEIKN